MSWRREKPENPALGHSNKQRDDESSGGKMEDGPFLRATEQVVHTSHPLVPSNLHSSFVKNGILPHFIDEGN